MELARALELAEGARFEVAVWVKGYLSRLQSEVACGLGRQLVLVERVAWVLGYRILPQTWGDDDHADWPVEGPGQQQHLGQTDLLNLARLELVPPHHQHIPVALSTFETNVQSHTRCQAIAAG